MASGSAKSDCFIKINRFSQLCFGVTGFAGNVDQQVEREREIQTCDVTYTVGETGQDVLMVIYSITNTRLNLIREIASLTQDFNDVF